MIATFLSLKQWLLSRNALIKVCYEYLRKNVVILAYNLFFYYNGAVKVLALGILSDG